VQAFDYHIFAKPTIMIAYQVVLVIQASLILVQQQQQQPLPP
jgi:hypothetical protein